MALLHGHLVALFGKIHLDKTTGDCKFSKKKYPELFFQTQVGAHFQLVLVLQGAVF